MQSTIIEFYKVIDGFHDPYNGDMNEEVEKMVENSEKVDTFRRRVASILYLDMEHLYDVDAFFTEKRQGPIILGPTYKNLNWMHPGHPKAYSMAVEKDIWRNKIPFNLLIDNTITIFQL